MKGAQPMMAPTGIRMNDTGLWLYIYMNAQRAIPAMVPMINPWRAL